MTLHLSTLAFFGYHLRMACMPVSRAVHLHILASHSWATLRQVPFGADTNFSKTSPTESRLIVHAKEFTKFKDWESIYSPAKSWFEIYGFLSRCVSRSQHRYIWYSTGGNYDVRINESGAWDEVPGLNIKFDLPEPASIRVLYSMSVMPDQNFASDGEF